MSGTGEFDPLAHYQIYEIMGPWPSGLGAGLLSRATQVQFLPLAPSWFSIMEVLWFEAPAIGVRFSGPGPELGA